MQNAVFQLTEDGFKVIVEEAKSVQAVAYIRKNSFNEYNLKIEKEDDSLVFGISLSIVCECLSMFVGATSPNFTTTTITDGHHQASVRIIYKGKGAPLIFVMAQCDDEEDDNLVTECSIKTREYLYEDDEMGVLDLNIENEDILNTVIMNGIEFWNILNDLDKQCEELELFLSQNEPYFRITTVGTLQSESNVEINKTSDIILKFDCKGEQKNRYKFKHIALMMKTLAISSKISIRTDAKGLLSLQVMIENEKDDSKKDSQIYIEYYIIPLEIYD